MCRVCEGFSFDDALLLTAAHIAEYGYVLQAVTGDDARGIQPWVYTVGLLDLVDHPEMIIAGPSLETCARVLEPLVQRVLDGERFLIGEGLDVGSGGKLRVGEVHDIQYQLGTFNIWHQLQRIGALESEELTALQIVVPEEWFCREHRDTQPDLSDINARVDRPLRRPNRAERRRRRPR